MFTVNEKFNTIFKTIGYKTRTDILIEIQKNPNLTLTELSKKFKMSLTTLIFHVQKLKNAKVVKSKRTKKGVMLSLNKATLLGAFKSLSLSLHLEK